MLHFVNIYVCLFLIHQAVPGHKRAPSDVSMASSEEDKVPPTPSTLESVTEKTEAEPGEDRSSDKLSDEGLGMSEVDKMEEEKLNEASLVPGLIETGNDLTSEDPAKAKLDKIEVEEISGEEVSKPEEPVDKSSSEAEGTEEEKETKIMEIQEEATQEKEDKNKLEQDQLKAEEAGIEVSVESQEIPEDTAAYREAKPEEESKDLNQETGEHIIQNIKNETVENTDTDHLPSDLINTTVNGEGYSIEESSTQAVLENQSETKDEVLKESEQPKPEDQTTAEDEVQEQAPSESSQVISEVSDQTVNSQDVSAKENGEKVTHVDEVISQDGISVQESETDSESRMEHGSPAVMKSDAEKDSDSGSSSAADSNSLDLNLSISSFLSKSKEGGSVSLQVKQSAPPLSYYQVISVIVVKDSLLFLQDLKRQKKTLKKTRKFMVDGVEVSVTTSKIVTDNDTKSEEMRFLRYGCVPSASFTVGSKFRT